MRHSVPIPLPQPLAPTILFSVSREPTALGTFYEWTQTSFVLLYLTYVTEHNALRVHPCCSICVSTAFLSGWTTFIVWMDHVLLVHSFVEGHMEYLHSSLTSLIFVE